MALPLLLLLTACGPDPVDVYLKDGPFLRSASTSYDVTQRADLLEVTIPYAFENKTGGVFYLEYCPVSAGIIPPILERKRGDDWETAWTLPDYACVPSRADLVPGQIYVDTLKVYAHPFGGDRKPQFSARDVTGTYRLRMLNVWKTWIYEQRPFGDAVDGRLRVSNEFQLRAP